LGFEDGEDIDGGDLIDVGEVVGWGFVGGGGHGEYFIKVGEAGRGAGCGPGGPPHKTWSRGIFGKIMRGFSELVRGEAKKSSGC